MDGTAAVSAEDVSMRNTCEIACLFGILPWMLISTLSSHQHPQGDRPRKIPCVSISIPSPLLEDSQCYKDVLSMNSEEQGSSNGPIGGGSDVCCQRAGRMRNRLKKYCVGYVAATTGISSTRQRESEERKHIACAESWWGCL